MMARGLALRGRTTTAKGAVTPTEAIGASNVEVVDDHQHSTGVSASPFAPFRHLAFFRLEMGVQVADTADPADPTSCTAVEVFRTDREQQDRAHRRNRRRL
jgi:hypothetical protein